MKRKPIDVDKMIALARLGCSQSEVAQHLGCNQPTISRRYAAEFARARLEYQARTIADRAAAVQSLGG